MTRYAIALGSNVGDRLVHLRAGIDEIGRLSDSRLVSGLYETAPIGGPEQDPYLNAVMVIESTLSPVDLLRQLQSIESGQDRERTVRWGPRTLDLDIVAMDPGTVDTEMLTIPHPRAAERRFVLEPLCDVWPDAAVGSGLTAAQARDQVRDQEVDLLASKWVEDGAKPGRYWVMAQLLLFVAFAIALVADGSMPGTSADPLNIVGGGPDGWRIVGAVILVVGGVSVAISARSLGRALTALPEPVAGATLVESGPYRYVRHPIYGAIFLILLGASLLFASTAGNLLSLGLLGFFWAKSRYEERQLRIVYPQYSSYRRRVTKRFIPFLV
ncbi:MAG: 2-amino-4-hydroxy-6-hydroxymethyldihydropteridine diphosphokinase [Acidimicrobiia bacterium]